MGDRRKQVKLWLMRHLCCCCVDPQSDEDDDILQARADVPASITPEQARDLQREMEAHNDRANLAAAKARQGAPKGAAKDVRDKLGDKCVRVNIAGDAAQAWKRSTGENIDTSLHQMIGELPYIRADSLDIDLKSGTNDVSIQVRAKKDGVGDLPNDGMAGSWDRRDCELSFTGKLVEGDDPHFYIDRLDTVRGNCAPFFSNLIDMWLALGLKKVRLSATDDGCYVWIRYGFRPDQESWNKLRAAGKDTLARVKKNPGLPNDIAREAAEILDNSKPDAIVGFTRLRTPLGDETLGIRLAKSSMWNGELDLTNAKLVAEVREYIDR